MTVTVFFGDTCHLVTFLCWRRSQTHAT